MCGDGCWSAVLNTVCRKLFLCGVLCSKLRNTESLLCGPGTLYIWGETSKRISRNERENIHKKTWPKHENTHTTAHRTAERAITKQSACLITAFSDWRLGETEQKKRFFNFSSLFFALLGGGVNGSTRQPNEEHEKNRVELWLVPGLCHNVMQANAESATGIGGAEEWALRGKLLQSMHASNRHRCNSSDVHSLA